MEFYTVNFFENAVPIDIPTMQIPGSFDKTQLTELINQSTNKNYSFMINNHFFEENLHFMVQKCNLTSEDTIEINCLTSEECNTPLIFDDFVSSFLFKNNDEFIVSLFNKKILFYKNNILVNEIKNELTIKKIFPDYFLTSENKIIKINNELINNELIKKEEINDELINEITKNNEFIISSYFNEESIICTNKSLYLINKNKEIKKTQSILPFVDLCFINESVFITSCHNKVIIQNKEDHKVKRAIQIQNQISNLQLENDLLILSAENKILFYKI